MFPGWGPIRFYPLITLISFVISASYLYRAFSAIPGIRRRDALLVLLGAFAVSEFVAPLVPYLYRVFTEGYSGPTWRAGRWFHAVFLSIFFYGLLMAKRLRWPIKKCIDQYMIGAMLMSAIGRIGCFLNGCCGGKPTGLPWGLCFPKAPDVPVHPTQLYMFGIELGLFFWLRRFQKKQRYDGQTFWTGVWAYSAYRFWIETLRTNPVAVMGLTAAQLLSLSALLLSSAVLIRHRSRGTAA